MRSFTPVVSLALSTSHNLHFFSYSQLSTFPLLQDAYCSKQSHWVVIMASTVDQKLLKQTKFPPEFNQRVDMQKVNVEVMKK